MRLKKKADLFDYQQTVIEFIQSRKSCAVWLDMGTGKTISVLTAIQALFADFAIAKVLVVAPLRVANSVWDEEIEEWEHTKGLRVSKILGTAEERRAALKKPADIYIINNENLLWLYRELRKNWDFDTVVLDEASRYRNANSKGFILLEKLRQYKKIERLIELTGTPSPNSYEEIWAPMFLLDRGKALNAPTIGVFREHHFDSREAFHGGKEYTLRKGQEAAIQKRLKNLVIAYKHERKESEKPLVNVIPVTLSEADMELYDELARDLVLEICDGVEIEAVNSGVLYGKLQQMASGNVYYEDEETNTRKVKHLHNAKLDALESVLEENRGKQILIGYAYRHEAEAIKKRFPEIQDIRDIKDAEKKWNQGKIRLMMGHPASMGHGLNLHKGGAHTMVWYGLTWNLEWYQQMNKRLDRTGQKNRVTIHILCCRDTLDETIVDRLAQKDVRQADLVDAVCKFLDHYRKS